MASEAVREARIHEMRLCAELIDGYGLSPREVRAATTAALRAEARRTGSCVVRKTARFWVELQEQVSAIAAERRRVM